MNQKLLSEARSLVEIMKKRGLMSAPTSVPIITQGQIDAIKRGKSGRFVKGEP